MIIFCFLRCELIDFVFIGFFDFLYFVVGMELFDLFRLELSKKIGVKFIYYGVKFKI